MDCVLVCLIEIMESGGRSGGSTSHIYRELGTIWGELLVGTRIYVRVGARKKVARIRPTEHSGCLPH